MLRAPVPFPLNKFRLAAILLSFILLVSLVGYSFYKNEKENIIMEKYQGLKEIADMKEKQIIQWLQERTTQARVLAEAPIMFKEVGSYFSERQDYNNREKIARVLNFYVSDYSYDAVMIVSNNGELILSSNKLQTPIDRIVKEKIIEACESRKIAFTDVYFSRNEKRILFDIISPIVINNSANYAFLLRRNLKNNFYPLIQTWYSFNKTTETALVRVENDSIIFLNNLRNYPNSALSLKAPLSKRGVAAVEAANGYKGMFEGLDYRGENVLADIRSIPSTNWFLITKVDRNEVLADLNERASFMAAITLLISLVLGFGFVWFYNNKQQSIYRELLTKEKEISRKQEEFKVTMDSLGEGVIIVNIDGKIANMNNTAQTLTGWNIREAKGRNIADVYIVRNETTGIIEENLFNKIVRNGMIKELANHSLLISKSGIEIPVMDTGAPIYSAENQLIGIAIAFQDETNKRTYLNKLVESEERFKNMFQNSASGMVLVSPQFIFLQANEAFCKMLGYEESEILGRSFQVFTHPDDREKGSKEIGKIIKEKEGKAYFEKRYISKNGDIIWGLVSAAVLKGSDNEPLNLVTQIVDISPLKHAEEKLKESRAKLSAALSSMTDAVVISDTNGNFIDFNDAFAAFHKFKTKEECAKMVSDYFTFLEVYLPNGELAPHEMWPISRALKGEMLSSAEYHLKRTDTGETWVGSYSISPIMDNNVITGAVLVARDITEIIKTAKALHESEERLRSTLDNLFEGCQIIGFDYKYLYLNDSAIEHAGRPLDALLGRTMMECYPGIEKTDMFSAINKCMIERIPNSMENRFLYPDGSEKFFKLDIEPVPEGIFIMSNDITQIREAEKQIQITNERFNRIVSSLNDIVWTASIKENKIIYLNQSFVNILGVDNADISDTPGLWTDYVHPDDKDVLEAGINKLNIDGIASSVYRIIRPDGEIRWLLDRRTLIYDNEGKPWQIGGIAKDITDIKLAEDKIRKNELYLTSVFNNIGETIFTLSYPSLTILHVNNSIEYTFGYTADEVIGKSTRIFYPTDEEYDKYNSELAEAVNKDNSVLTNELLLHKKDGSEIYCEFTTTFLKIGNKDIQVITLLRDITEKKKIINELTAAKDKAEVMSRLKSNFLANMSHELRTPLIGITGFAEFLSQDLTDPGQKEMAENILASGSRLSETLNLILDLSRIESENINLYFEMIDLTKETESIVYSFSNAAYKKGLKLTGIYDSPSIKANIDLRAYRSILNNLISNAVKFTHKGSIEVSLAHDNKIITLSVKDTGIGISEDNLPIIFEEFRQVSEGFSRNFEGTGLGLNITKKLVEKFGGEISVKSTLGAGTVFTVVLPVRIAPSKTVVTDKNNDNNSDDVKTDLKLSILLIDDDEFVFRIINRYLKDKLELTYCNNSDTAFKAINEKHFDLILMDINLKDGIDGKEATKIIRKINGYESVPIVAITAYAMLGDKEEFIEAGCSHYISKPFSHSDIENLINGIIAQMIHKEKA